MNYHPIINYFVEAGVPIETVYLLLMLPVIATLVAFFRQIVGIKAFGIYTPSIITFAFLAFGEKGLKYGIAIFFAVIGMGMLARYILRSFRLLYLPRVAITLSIISLTVLGILAFGATLQRTGIAAVDIFPLLILITLAEKFIATQIEQGTKIALFLAGETLVISIVGYFVIGWPALRDFFLQYPWAIALTFLINIGLGKWSGLRLVELFRFRHILKQES
ncbi:MAG: 7TM domain-containing protein [Candidatus Moraniibacteriota bacterium]